LYIGINKGRTIRNPGRGDSQKKFVQRKMPGKKIRAARKKIRASKQQSTNSLEKKFVQRLNALKKILQRHEIEKKIRAAKILYPPGISNGPPLNVTS
jgi:hypothetical protein